MMHYCHKCEKHDNSLIYLWDGNYYCEDCITAVSRKLLNYVKENSIIKETMPRNYLQYYHYFCWLILGGFALWIGLLLVFDNENYRINGLLDLLLILLALYIFSALMDIITFKRNRPTVMVDNEIVEVIRPKWKKISRKLSECKWKSSTHHKDSGVMWLSSCNLLKTPKVIILIIPLYKKSWLKLFTHKAACGWDEDMYEIWKAFLTLAKVKNTNFINKL